jgi:hypothetical protein
VAWGVLALVLFCAKRPAPVVAQLPETTAVLPLVPLPATWINALYHCIGCQDQNLKMWHQDMQGLHQTKILHTTDSVIEAAASESSCGYDELFHSQNQEINGRSLWPQGAVTL